jgi:bacterial/archaeal transporter family protein
MWILLGVVSAILLGVYDIFKKVSLDENAVLPVLFFSTIVGALIFVPVLMLSRLNPDLLNHYWYIKPQNLSEHLHFFVKSLIVATSWVLAYFAMKNLPITIVSPINASGPMWTLFGALIFFSESMNFWQWCGLIVTIGFYYLFSLSGKKEGISFRKNKWVLFMTLSTIIGSVSSLYDKYLLQVQHYDRLAMQCWYSIYLVPITAVLMVFVWMPNRAKYAPFQWRNAILLIGLALIISDFAYFWALSFPGALIAIIATIRRSSIMVSFAFGALMLKEKNVRSKVLILLGIFAGIGMIILGS